MSWENPRRRRRRTAPRRRRPSLRRLFRRRKVTIPFETLVGAASLPFISPSDAWKEGAPYNQITTYKSLTGALRGLLAGFTGICIYDDSGKNILYPNWAQVINPLDFSTARYWKILLWTSLFGMLRKRLVRSSSALFKKIPLIGRWVS